MKKLGLISSLIIISLNLISQKYNVTGAFNLAREYRVSRNCEKASEAIEKINQATQDEITKDMVKTWYYRGGINYDILTYKNCPKLLEKALENVTESYFKALALNFKNDDFKQLDLKKDVDIKRFREAKAEKMISKNFYSKMMERLVGVAGELTNKGYEKYKEKDFSNASANFMMAHNINKVINRIDTHTVFNAAISFKQTNDTNQVIALYNELIDLGYNSENRGSSLYLTLARVYLEKGNKNLFFQTLKKGKRKYPKDKSLMLEDLNYLIKNGKSKEAMLSLNTAIEKEPTNSIFYAVRGKIYNELKQKELALKDFNKALELDSKNYEALYDLVIHYFNAGADKVNEANDVPLNQKTKYKALKTKSKDFFTKAVGYAETALKIRPSDTDLVKVMLQLYTHTKNYEKLKSLKKEYH